MVIFHSYVKLPEGMFYVAPGKDKRYRKVTDGFPLTNESARGFCQIKMNGSEEIEWMIQTLVQRGARDR